MRSFLSMFYVPFCQERGVAYQSLVKVKTWGHRYLSTPMREVWTLRLSVSRKETYVSVVSVTVSSSEGGVATVPISLKEGSVAILYMSIPEKEMWQMRLKVPVKLCLESTALSPCNFERFLPLKLTYL